ncbi:hypothetical protein EZV62_002052 [Acer yangbiense]|uniref:Protein FAR1-RELATED SEQUENCE n=1 Tax=Acer yangbiense TaxID=1000413 RepID=A0A5C7IW67_9ROSI|nr:hypothetical protein EZV62_002052 [Acer yangbiense]
MDVEVIQVEGDMGHRGVSDDGDAEPNEGVEVNNAKNSLSHGDEDGILEPYLGMEFDTEDAAKAFYDEYARRMGFSSKASQHTCSKADGATVSREFVCGKEGLKKRHADSCDAMLRIELKGQDIWVVTKFVKEHNHSMVSPSKVHYLRPRRHFAGTTKNMAEVYQGVGIVPSGVMYVSMDGNRASVETNNRVARTTPHMEHQLKNTGALNYVVRDSFFASISPNQGFDGSFFDGYVNQQTTIPMFFRQYERALENWFEREIEADFDTICTMPVLRTPSPMEKQAANFYTRKIFAKFQEELVETFVYTANRIDGDGAINTFRVAKFEDDNKAYIVTLNYQEMRANCSCQMFEYSGILCRHVLTVFTVTNVLTLPSHYILKRWTRNAKTGAGIDEQSGELNGHESLTLRYNNLCREAIKYAEDGAIAVDTYNAALSCLREGGKKVAVVKKNVAKVAPPGSQVSGAGYDDMKTSTSAPDGTPLLWPRQDEMTRRFNLNDAGTPVQPVSDLNLPRMAPVSLHRDDGPSDNMVVLPCLKSMTWVMENKNSTPGNRVAVINLKDMFKLFDILVACAFIEFSFEAQLRLSEQLLGFCNSVAAYLTAEMGIIYLCVYVNLLHLSSLQLQDYSKTPSAEFEVKFQLSRVTLEPMLRSMAYISEQLSTPANRVAVINLKLQDTETTTGESEVKFQVSKDTLGAMLRSMAYIREQLSIDADPHSEPLPKKQRK